jgi:hypothetical protein
VAGKGHETGQEVAGTLHPFDDRAVLREALRAAGRGGADTVTELARSCGDTAPRSAGPTSAGEETP